MEIKRFSLKIKSFNTNTKRRQLNQVSTCQNQFYSTVTESTYLTSHHHARNGQFFRRSPDDRPALCRGPQVHQQGKGSKLTFAQGATRRWTAERDEQWASQKQVQSPAKESGGQFKVIIQSNSPVDFRTLPVDCRNFIALTAVLLCYVLLWRKNNASKFQ